VIALGVFVGLLLPPLAGLLRPLLVPAILGPFLIALLRVDWRRLRARLDRPTPVLLSTLGLLLICPAAVHLALPPLGLPEAIHGGLVLMAAAPPLMASGYLALLFGLDAPPAVMLTLVSTALMPFTLPLVGLYLLGVDIDVPLGDLMLRLAAVVCGTLVLAALLRWLLPAALAERHAEPLEGLAVLGLLVFAIRDHGRRCGHAAARAGVRARLRGHRLWPERRLADRRRPAVRAARAAWRAHGRPVQRRWQPRPAAGGDRRSRLARAPGVHRDGELPIYTLPLIQRPLYRRWLSTSRSASALRPERGDA
jgi:Sodium Bile acid symporter family